MLAFSELSGERRQLPDTVLRIESRAIREWAREYGLADDIEFVEELKAHIRALDTFYVDFEVKRMKARNKGKGNGKSPKLREENAGVRRRHSEATERD
jgi:hypothetical protein